MNKRIIAVGLTMLVVLIVVFLLRKPYTYDGNIAVLKEKACLRELAIISGSESVVPRYEIIKGCREGGKLQMLLAINNTNATSWVSCAEETPLIIAFALDCVRKDEHVDSLCDTYLLVGTVGYKLRSGTNDANRVLNILNRHDGDLDKCNASELFGD